MRLRRRPFLRVAWGLCAGGCAGGKVTPLPVELWQVGEWRDGTQGTPLGYRPHADRCRAAILIPPALVGCRNTCLGRYRLGNSRGKSVAFSDGLDIENFEVNNALNFRITNKHARDGLADDVLILHSVKLCNGRRQFQTVESLSKVLPLILTNDQPGLPYKVPRMFQLVQFTDRSAPFVQGYFGSDHNLRLVAMPLPSRGFWQFGMELRWAGGSMQIPRVFHWGESSLPTFCKLLS